MASHVIKTNQTEKEPRFIAGADISIKRFETAATAAVVVLSYPDLVPIDLSVIEEKVSFPYVPGLLSFRESPLVLHACEKLKCDFDLLLIDGHGYAHPRRVGLACHLGILLDKPTIGCAKSLLTGEYEDPPAKRGSYTNIMDKGEIIGAAVRTKDGVKPVFVSIGHRVDLAVSIQLVLACCKGYRIPEPLRLAHLIAGGMKTLSTNF